MNPFEKHSDSFSTNNRESIPSSEDEPKGRKRWGERKSKHSFNYHNRESEDEADDNNFLEDLGFRKDDEVEESNSKFSSHADYMPPIPTKSDLIRTDSNAITEENLD